MKIVLTAVPGAGKSTIIKKIRELRGDIKTINFGDIMFEVAKEKYAITDRDLMRSILTPDDYRVVQTLAAKKISEMKGDIVVDTHCSILTPRGYYPGLPEEVVKRLEPDVIVLLEYDPTEIAKRRAKDIGSSERAGREVEIGETIELQQQMNRSYAAAYATLARSSVKIISLREKERYKFEHAETASKKIVELLGES
jgi:adenylate kinase